MQNVNGQKSPVNKPEKDKKDIIGKKWRKQTILKRRNKTGQ